MQRILLLVGLALASTIASAGDPIVIAHRGASGYLPEHTLAGYELAIDQGADFIEPDLVITKDGQLVARHDIYLGSTTNVADRPEFADRLKTVEGRSDWYAEDFTLAELKTLRARQAFPGRSKAYDDKYEIPTFQEVLDLVKRKDEETGHVIGIYPETKAPSHYHDLGFDFAVLLIMALERNGLNSEDAPVFVQSFEPEVLRELRRMSTVRLVMLVSPVSREAPNTPNIPLEDIARFADGVGPLKVLLVKPDLSSSGFVEEAHALGLLVHPWTFRQDSYPVEIFSSVEAELQHYLDLGVDGYFTDFPDVGVSVRNANLLGHPK